MSNGDISRKIYVDFLKGLCMCLVIIGHCRIPELGIRFIYLFHVPMFFFLSGLLYKERSAVEECKKSARSLLWPYFLGFLIVGVKYSIDVVRGIDITSLYRFLVSVLVVGPKIDVMGFTNLQVGAIWFLPSLFICRVVFQFFNGFALKSPLWRKKDSAGMLFCIFLMAGSFFAAMTLRDGASVLGLSQAVAAMFFYAAGVASQKMETGAWGHKWNKISYLFVFSFASIIFFESIDLYTMKFPVWWSGISSLAAMIFLVNGARLMEKRQNMIVELIALVGKNSLLLLLVHYYEMMTFDWNKISCTGNFLPLIRLSVDLVVFAVLLKIPGVKRILRLS